VEWRFVSASISVVLHAFDGAGSLTLWAAHDVVISAANANVKIFVLIFLIFVVVFSLSRGA
jgi:hypothetical protein